MASHCVVRDSLIDKGAEIRSFSHLDGARVGEGALVGPFARLRPGAVLEADAHAGNFVELKKACLGKGAKANHLSYLGDARVGAGANIGAGTITCNYDGKHKYQTTIGEKAFIGSNTALVAPVSVGDNALVGAGSVITRDVPENEMGIARSRQKNLPRRGEGWCGVAALELAVAIRSGLFVVALCAPWRIGVVAAGCLVQPPPMASAALFLRISA